MKQEDIDGENFGIFIGIIMLFSPIIVGFILLLTMLFSSFQTNRHIGSTSLYNGEQVELIKYEGKGMYKVRPISDTTWTLHVNENDLQ